MAEGHKAKKNETSFKEGNNAAEIWSSEVVRNTLMEMRSNAETDAEILCLQDAIKSVGLYQSSLNYLVNKYPEFETIKEDISALIIARVNRGALKSAYNSTASIWRMKQLGEKDKTETDITTKGGSIQMPPIIIQ